MKETLYSPIEYKQYKNGIFESRFVKNSKHKINKIYLRINDNYFDLRTDEIYAIITILGEALWCDYHISEEEKKKLEWKTKNES